MYILLYDPTPYDAVPFELYDLTLKYFDSFAIMSCNDTLLPPLYLTSVNFWNTSLCMQNERFKSFCCFQYSAESSLSIKLCSTMSASNCFTFKQLMRLAYITCKAKMYLYTLCYAILSASSYVLFSFLMLVSLGNYSLCGFSLQESESGLLSVSFSAMTNIMRMSFLFLKRTYIYTILKNISSASTLFTFKYQYCNMLA